MAARKPDTCGNCRFARPLVGNDEAISCQWAPPRVTSVDGTTVKSNWPLLGKENWCGQHKKKSAGE